MIIIYRIATLEVITQMSERGNQNATDRAITAEINNILRAPNQGGIASDYSFLTVEKEQGIPTINPDLTVTFTPPPVGRDFRADYQAAVSVDARLQIIAERLRLV